MFGEVDPAGGGVDRTMLPSWFDAGREREAGDGEADQLALTAAETADGIAHKKNFGEVLAAQSRAAEGLAGTELALDRDAVEGIQTEVRGAALGGVGSLFPFAVVFEFVL